MNLTQRHLQPEQVAGAFGALSVYNRPVDGYIRAVYTRQPAGNWTYYIGQCVLGQEARSDHAEVYRTFAFVGRQMNQITIKVLLEMLAKDGIEMGSGLPPIRLKTALSNWNEELVPSHASTRSRTAMRRLTVSVESNAFFPDTQLMDYELPYRPSAARYVKEFLGLAAFHDSNDGRRGEFSVEVPDTRGAIRFAGGLISIRDPTVPLRLVGTINEDLAVDVRNENTADYDEETVSRVELWLLTKENELVDYVSTSNWPHKFTTAPQQAREERLLKLIRGGESEFCEFKPYIDLQHEKAADLEKAVCAFSNQRGGTMFIGVTKDADIDGVAGDVARGGKEVASAITTYADEIRKRLREALKDTQCFDLSVESVAGTSVIVVTVEKSGVVNFAVKFQHKGTAFIRHGATSMKLTPTEIQAMMEARIAQQRMV